MIETIIKQMMKRKKMKRLVILATDKAELGMAQRGITIPHSYIHNTYHLPVCLPL
jgi:hypothetical protein